MTFSEYIDRIKEKEIAVIGIGVSNTPLIRRLLAEGCRVAAYDRSPAERLGPVAEELAGLGADISSLVPADILPEIVKKIRKDAAR